MGETTGIAWTDPAEWPADLRVQEWPRPPRGEIDP